MPDIQITKRHSFTGHSSGIFDLQAINDHQLLSAGGDGQTVMWDIKNPKDGQVIAKVNSTVYSVLVDGDHLLVGENSRAIHLVRLSDKRPLRSMEIKSPIFAIERIGDSYYVGTGAGELFIFDLELNLEKKVRLAPKSLRSISANDTDIALAYSDNVIRIIDRTTLEPKYEAKGHSLSVFSAKYHPKNNQLVSTGRDATIRVWDTFNHYEEVRSIAAHMYATNKLTFRLSGNYFATGSMDKTIKIWDATTFALLKVIDKARHDGHTNSVNSLLWMEYDNLLVTCSDDRSIAVWDIKFD